MAPLSPAWQQSLNPDFVQRLSAPVTQPGVVNSQMASTIIERTSRLQNRLPLLTAQMQRWATVIDLETEQTPIIYAQPSGQENRAPDAAQGIPSIQHSNTNPEPSLEQNNLPLIQAKWVQVSNAPAGDTGSLRSQTAQSQQSISPLAFVTAVPLAKRNVQPPSAQPLGIEYQGEQVSSANTISSFPIIQVNNRRTARKSSVVNSKAAVKETFSIGQPQSNQSVSVSSIQLSYPKAYPQHNS